MPSQDNRLLLFHLFAYEYIMRQRRIYCGTELCENRNETHAIAEDDNIETMPVIELLFPCSVRIVYLPTTCPTSLSKFYIGTRQYS